VPPWARSNSSRVVSGPRACRSARSARSGNPDAKRARARRTARRRATGCFFGVAGRTPIFYTAWLRLRLRHYFDQRARFGQAADAHYLHLAVTLPERPRAEPSASWATRLRPRNFIEVAIVVVEIYRRSLGEDDAELMTHRTQPCGSASAARSDYTNATSRALFCCRSRPVIAAPQYRPNGAVDPQGLRFVADLFGPSHTTTLSNCSRRQRNTVVPYLQAGAGLPVRRPEHWGGGLRSSRPVGETVRVGGEPALGNGCARCEGAKTKYLRRV
jgi:hypothetical protein